MLLDMSESQVENTSNLSKQELRKQAKKEKADVKALKKAASIAKRENEEEKKPSNQTKKNQPKATPPVTQDNAPRERKVSVNTQPQSMRVPSNLRMDEPAQQRKMARNLGKMHLAQVRPQMKCKPPQVQHLPCYDVTQASLSGSLKLGSEISAKSDFVFLAHTIENSLFVDSYEMIQKLFQAFDAILRKYDAPKNEDFGRDFQHYMARHVDFLNYCSPLPVNVRCLIDKLKQKLTEIESLREEEEKCKLALNEELHKFHLERIQDPVKMICQIAAEHIPPGSHLLVMGGSGSWLVARVIIYLQREYMKANQPGLCVTVIDVAPLFEGRKLITLLRQAAEKWNLGESLIIQYAQFTSVPTIMPDVDMVLLGANALLSNSHVLATIGSSGVAHIAKLFGKQLLVVMETCEFWEFKQADAFEFNHLLDPRMLLTESTLFRRSGNADVSNAAKKLLHYINDSQSHTTTVQEDAMCLKIHNMALDLIDKSCVSRIINDVGSVLPTCGNVLHRSKPGAEFNNADI